MSGNDINVYVDASCSNPSTGISICGMFIPVARHIHLCILDEYYPSTTAEFIGFNKFVDDILYPQPATKYVVHTDCLRIMREGHQRDDLIYTKESGHGKNTPIEFKVIDRATRMLLRKLIKHPNVDADEHISAVIAKSLRYWDSKQKLML